jgi:hypothetical protein
MRTRSRLASIVAGLLAAAVFVQPAQAWIYFTVTGPGGTPIARVAQQIVAAPLNGAPAALGLDYIYRVLNIGPKAIKGFSVRTGAKPVGGVVRTFNPAPFGFGFITNFGAMGNANVPFLTGEGNTFSPGPWQFKELDNRPAAITGYVAHWAALPLGTPVLPPNRWTEFDLFSSNPPVVGGGAVDLPGPGALGFDLEDGVAPDLENFVFDASFTYDMQVPVDNSRDMSDAFPGMDAAGPGGSLPEPTSMLLCATGLALAMSGRRGRRAGR